MQVFGTVLLVGGLVMGPPPECRPTGRGTGLIVAASAAGAAGIGASLGVVGMQYKMCSLDGEIVPRASFDAEACLTDISWGLAGLAIAANAAAIGLAAGAGVQRGRYEARLGRERRYRLILGLGAGLAIVAAPALMLTYPLSVPVISNCGRDDDCRRRLTVGRILTIQLAASALGVAGGFLGYGGAYAKHRIAVTPLARPQTAGAMLSGEF